MAGKHPFHPVTFHLDFCWGRDHEINARGDTLKHDPLI